MQALAIALALLAALVPARPRARDLGIKPGILEPGPLNAITDVTGVRVGHATLIRGENIRTGVTAVLPHGGNLFREKVPGAVFVGNAFGKLAGSTQVEELGEIESPILLTSTLNVARVLDGGIDYMLALPGNEDVKSINIVVGETNDRGLNDVRARPVGREDVLAAIRGAKQGPVEEGSVGAGTGTVAFGWKGGIGTSSRKLPASLGGWTVGVLVQTNFGGVLTIDGAPVGRALGQYYLKKELENADGSCMIVIATDAPVDARNLKRMAARSMAGMARTGSAFSNGSGDYAIAFSTARNATALVKNDDMSSLFLAVIEATEEAIYNSLFKATSVGGGIEALPVERVRPLLGVH
jgi:D-aminopeptidase